MKISVIAISALSAFFTSSAALAGSFEDHFGGQEGVNAHFQGSINDMQDFDHHLQGSINDDRKRIKAVESLAADTRAWTDRQEGALRGMQGDIKANTEWNDRQEGVIRQNRGRLDENDARNQRQDDSIDNAHARIGGVKHQVDDNSQSIGFLGEAHTITNKRVNANASAITATQARAEDVNSQSIRRDKELGGRLDQQAQRDDALAAESGRIESESVRRDTVIANQVDYNEQVNAAYRRQSAAQFEQHGAAIESNRQAIADERDARQAADRDLQAGIAAAIASGSHIMDANYHGLQVSIAGGAYRGTSAASLALGGALSSSTFAHVNVSHDSRGNQAVGGNVAWKF